MKSLLSTDASLLANDNVNVADGGTCAKQLLDQKLKYSTSLNVILQSHQFASANISTQMSTQWPLS